MPTALVAERMNELFSRHTAVSILVHIMEQFLAIRRAYTEKKQLPPSSSCSPPHFQIQSLWCYTLFSTSRWLLVDIVHHSLSAFHHKLKLGIGNVTLALNIHHAEGKGLQMRGLDIHTIRTSFSSCEPLVRIRRPRMYSSKVTRVSRFVLKALNSISVKTVSLTNPKRPRESRNSRLSVKTNCINEVILRIQISLILRIRLEVVEIILQISFRKSRFNLLIMKTLFLLTASAEISILSDMMWLWNHFLFK